MNILVVLRPVRDPASFTVNRKAQKIFIHRESFIINPSDRNALEAALALAGAEHSVTAVAYGAEPALAVLRQARATGASRAIWVPAPQTVVPDPVGLDALSATKILQHVVTFVGSVDLLLLGAEVLDADMAQVGPRLAAALDWPFVEGAHEARALPQGGLGLVVAAQGGQYRLLGVDTPAVATMARDSNQPRFAPAARIITVYQDPAAVESVTPAGLGLDPAELAPVVLLRGESFPPERTFGQLVEGQGALHQLAVALSANARA
jgi:electron transfer flavoprotein beta subunit